MNKENKIAFIEKVKKECGLDEIRPIFMNEVHNDLGLLQINKYICKVGKRALINFVTSHNANVLRHRWTDGDKNIVVYNITHNGNNARTIEEIGICLIEVLDSDVLSEEEFNELYNIVITKGKRNDDLYKRLVHAMLKEIKKDEKSIEAWESISFGFKDKIGLEIWQGVLQPN